MRSYQFPGEDKTQAVTCQSDHIQYRQNNPITSPLSCCTVPPQELDNHIHHIPSQLSQVYLGNCTIIILTIFSFIAIQLRLTPRTHVSIPIHVRIQRFAETEADRPTSNIHRTRRSSLNSNSIFLHARTCTQTCKFTRFVENGSSMRSSEAVF